MWKALLKITRIPAATIQIMKAPFVLVVHFQTDNHPNKTIKRSKSASCMIFQQGPVQRVQAHPHQRSQLSQSPSKSQKIRVPEASRVQEISEVTRKPSTQVLFVCCMFIILHFIYSIIIRVIINS